MICSDPYAEWRKDGGNFSLSETGLERQSVHGLFKLRLFVEEDAISFV